MSRDEPGFRPTDLTRDHMGAWRNHPVTKLIFQYLKDREETIELNVLAGWKSGQIKIVDEQVFRGQVMAFEHVRGLAWDQVMEFYGIQTAPAQDPNQPTLNTEPKEDDGIQIDE